MDGRRENENKSKIKNGTRLMMAAAAAVLVVDGDVMLAFHFVVLYGIK